MDNSTEFLTTEECRKVDAALLTAREKFTARVAIYALRSLKTIALEESTREKSEVAIEELSQDTIIDWIHSDPTLQEQVDRSFRAFFAKIVLGALGPLKDIAQAHNCGIQSLTVEMVISHYEALAKEAIANL